MCKKYPCSELLSSYFSAFGLNTEIAFLNFSAYEKLKHPDWSVQISFHESVDSIS